MIGIIKGGDANVSLSIFSDINGWDGAITF